VCRPLLVIALIALAALAAASVPLFILYDDDEVTKADAVIVVAGQKQRLPVALEFAFVGAPNPRLRLPISIALEWVKLGSATVRREC
jgi:hypothetical protein